MSRQPTRKRRTAAAELQPIFQQLEAIAQGLRALRAAPQTRTHETTDARLDAVAAALGRTVERFSEEVWALRSARPVPAAEQRAEPRVERTEGSSAGPAVELIRDELHRLREDMRELRGYVVGALTVSGGPMAHAKIDAQPLQQGPETGDAEVRAEPTPPAVTGEDAKQLVVLQAHYAELRQVLQAQLSAAMARGLMAEQHRLDAALSRVRQTEEHLASLDSWQGLVHNEVQTLKSAMLLESAAGVHARVANSASGRTALTPPAAPASEPAPEVPARAATVPQPPPQRPVELQIPDTRTSDPQIGDRRRTPRYPPGVMPIELVD